MAKNFDMKELVENAIGEDDLGLVNTKKKVVVTKDEDEYDDDPYGPDPFETDDPSWKGIRYFNLINGGRTLNICFSKFFGKDASDYEDFITSYVSKKAYAGRMPMFCNTANVILNANKKVTGTFLYKYYSIKRDIDNVSYDHGDFIQFINAIINLFDVGIVNEIRKYVNGKFRETGDIKYEQNKASFIPSITFLDYHVKILFVVSRMIHLVIPLCLGFLKEYKEIDAKILLSETFTSLFPIAQRVGPDVVPLGKDDRESDVYQKLYSFVEAKVKDTLNSDAVMWESQAFLGVNYKTTIETIVNKLIVDIVPEYAFKGEPIKFNATVVKKSVQDYTLRKKYPFNINCLVDVDSNAGDDDNAVVTEAEQFDSYNSKHDELSIIIRHTFAEDTVNKIMQRKGIILDPAEVEWYTKNVRFHEFQTFAIFAAFASYFGGTENIYGINQQSYVKLMLTVTKMLERSNLASLAKYVTGARNRHYMTRTERRLSRNILIADPLYNHIISTKYKAVKNIISKKNNFIERRINYLTNNEFLYVTPNEDLNGRIISRDEEVIRHDVLQFYNMFIF